MRSGARTRRESPVITVVLAAATGLVRYLVGRFPVEEAEREKDERGEAAQGGQEQGVEHGRRRPIR